MSRKPPDKSIFYGLLKSLEAEYERAWSAESSSDSEANAVFEEDQIDSADFLMKSNGTCFVARPKILSEGRPSVYEVDEMAMGSLVDFMVESPERQITPVSPGLHASESIRVSKNSLMDHSCDGDDCPTQPILQESRKTSHGSRSSGHTTQSTRMLDDTQEESEVSQLSFDDDDGFSAIIEPCTQCTPLVESATCQSLAVAYVSRKAWLDHAEVFSEPLVELNRRSITRDLSNFTVTKVTPNTSVSASEHYVMHARTSLEYMSAVSSCVSHAFRGVGSSKKTASLREACMIHPRSRRRRSWILVSAILLIYDIVMVPLEVCFETPLTAFTLSMTLISRIFWTLDIPMSFLTSAHGELFMKPREVARQYLKTWFVFDFLLVIVEWTSIVVSYTLKSSSAGSPMRAIGWSRIIRLLRLGRLIKIQKIKPYVYGMLTTHVLSSIELFVQATLSLMLAFHCLTCVWHLIGDSSDEGWVSNSGLKNAPMAQRYAISLHWLLLHAQADGSGIQLATTTEYFVDSLICLVSFMLGARFVAAMVHLVNAIAASGASQLSKASRRYSNRHRLSPELAYRMKQYLATVHYSGPVEIQDEEKLLLAALPEEMKNNLQFEARVGILQRVVFFTDMLTRTPQVLLTLTCKMHYIVAIKGEIFFCSGGVCSQMLLITGGRFCYECDEMSLKLTPRSASQLRRWGPVEGQDTLLKGDVVSEAALWTTWEHHGVLTSCVDALLVGMEADVFAEQIIAHHRATVHAVKYARHFCWHLCRAERDGVACDVTGFDLSFSDLDAPLHIGGFQDHFAFVSHFKVEAGTEAALMRREIELFIRKSPSHPANDFRAPIFVDSDDLVELSSIQDHVRGSLALIILLTPGFLSRPWCLLELVTAKRSKRSFVPVLLSRRGLIYEFPDTDFYAKLHRDEIVAGGADGRKVLEDNGTDMHEVEQAIRLLFEMIALPFSPHKSSVVREAEVTDIVKRCMKLTAKDLRKLVDDDMDGLL